MVKKSISFLISLMLILSLALAAQAAEPTVHDFANPVGQASVWMWSS